MSKLFRNLPLTGKLTLIAILPLILSIFLTFQLLKEKQGKLLLVRNFREQISTAHAVLRLASEMQKELRWTYVHGLGQDKSQDLIKQRSINDSLIKSLQQSSDFSLAGFKEYTFLNELNSVRNKVDSHIIRSDEAVSYYINAIYRLQSLTNTGAIKNGYLKSVEKEIVCHRIIAHMMTYYGIMRLNIYNVLYTGQNALGTLYGLNGIYEIYKSYEKELSIKGNPDVIDSYNRSLSGSALQATNSYMDSLFKSFAFTDAFTAEKWWKESQNSLDQLQSIRNQIRSDIETHLGQLYQAEKWSRDRTLILLSACLLAMVAIIIYMVSILDKMLKEINVAAKKISAGITDVEFKSYSKDIIGSLARSISSMAKSNRALADTAQSIGKGEFTVAVHPRSKEDRLGNAIRQMKADLIKLNEEQKLKQQEITKAVLKGQEVERTRIGEELHDNINQLLSSAKLYLSFIQTNKANQDELMNKTEEILEMAIQEIRKLSKQLVIAGLRTDTLEQSIRELANDLGSVTQIDIMLFVKNVKEADMSDELKVAIYRIVQEQLNNILKYADAGRVMINISEMQGRIEIVIEDNGKGFDPSATRSGIGLINISSRAEAFEGFSKIDSAPGKGCRLHVSLHAQKAISFGGTPSALHLRSA